MNFVCIVFCFLSSYALDENEVIGVLNAEEELIIETRGKHPFTMMVYPCTVSVEAVKDFIAKEIRIPKDEQILRWIDRNDTAVDCESLTQMFLTAHWEPVLKVDKDKPISVMVVLARERIENKVEINWSATVNDLKEKLVEGGICGISAKLRFGDLEISLWGDRKLIDLGFKDNSKIIVSQTGSSTLRGFSGSTFDG